MRWDRSYVNTIRLRHFINFSFLRKRRLGAQKNIFSKYINYILNKYNCRKQGSGLLWMPRTYKCHLATNTNCQEGKGRSACGLLRRCQWLWFSASWDSVDNVRRGAPEEWVAASSSQGILRWNDYYYNNKSMHKTPVRQAPENIKWMEIKPSKSPSISTVKRWLTEGRFRMNNEPKSGQPEDGE